MWFVLSLGTAVFAATSDAFAKDLLRRHSARLISFVKVFWGSLFLLPLLFFAPLPSNPRLFWGLVLLAIPLEVIASLMFQTAIRVSPLSLTIPFLAFTPVFIMGLGWIFLHEALTMKGIAGVISVAAGAFIVQSELRGSSGPFWKSKEKGPVLMMIVSFIFAITSVLAKRALMASSPHFFSGVYFALITLALLPFQWTNARWSSEIFSEWKLYLALGACEAFAFILQFHAFWMKEAAYVIAVKRLSLLLSVGYGYVIFKERHQSSRTIGAVLMVIGAILIAFA